VWILENRAAAMSARALRDQIRSVTLLTALFGVAWLIAGNVWIIGDEAPSVSIPNNIPNLPASLMPNPALQQTYGVGVEPMSSGFTSFGVVPAACKDGKMGNRNLYHFGLAIIIFLDITVPLCLFAVFARTFLNRTLAFVMASPASNVPSAVGSDPKADPATMKAMASAENIYIGQA